MPQPTAWHPGGDHAQVRVTIGAVIRARSVLGAGVFFEMERHGSHSLLILASPTLLIPQGTASDGAQLSGQALAAQPWSRREAD